MEQVFDIVLENEKIRDQSLIKLRNNLLGMNPVDSKKETKNKNILMLHEHYNPPGDIDEENFKKYIDDFVEIFSHANLKLEIDLNLI